MFTYLSSNLPRVVWMCHDFDFSPEGGRTAKMREIVEALVAAGYDSLDSHAAALGLSRSTMWTIIKAAHKSSGLSGKTLKRMLSAPGLHPLVRRKILEYIEEKNDGRYGSTGNCLRRFNQRLGAASRATAISWSPTTGEN